LVNYQNQPEESPHCGYIYSLMTKYTLFCIQVYYRRSVRFWRK